MGLLLLKLLCLWVVGSCIIGPMLTWVIFRQHRRDRDIEEIRSSMAQISRRGEYSFPSEAF
jgi:hypothetical protein